MAKFKLYLLTFQNDIKEKNQLSNKYLANLISEFTSQVSTKTIGGDTREHFIYNTNNSFCYTYDEQLSLHQNSQKELTFKMDFKVYRDDRLEDNPYAQNLIVGSQLLLEDAYGQQHLFTVKNINIELSNVNTVCTYSCQDSFTFQLSKQNDGYEITNDINNEDFIGAHTVDWWVQKKIVPECFVYYQYIPLAKKGYTDDYYKQTIPFSGSGTADSILISLGETLDLNLHVYEHFNEKDGTLIQQFWFEPSKNPEVSGLSYSPYANLQSLSLTHNGDSLTSVLNVYGGTFGDERITLLPTIPMLFKKVFASDEWMKTPYYQGMFNDIVYGQTIKINLDDIEEEFDSKIENGYLKLNFTNIIDITSLKWLNYYDYYKFTKTDNSSWANIGYSGKSVYIVQSAMTKSWLLGNGNKTYNSYEDFHKDFQKGNKDLYLYIPITEGELPNNYNKEKPDVIFKTSLSGIFYLSFYRQPSEDETMFATIAEQCPWLENKLLDFSYFINHNLLNSYEYGILIQQIYNNLRQINGRLIYLADSYYKALSEKTKFLAQLDERVTNLGAKFTAEFLQPYLNQKQIREEDVQDFLLDYKTLYAVPEAKRAIFNYNEIYSSYINKYLGAEQRFLKNIYDFRDYWNAPVTIEGATKLYCYVAIPRTGYSFNLQQLSTRNFKDYNKDTFESNVAIFDAKTNNIITIVNNNSTSANYYNHFKWAKYAENTFIECSVDNKNNIYDREKTYYKKIQTTVGEGETASTITTYQPLKYDDIKLEFFSKHKKDYYFKNIDSYENKFLNIEEICNFYNKFTDNALQKLVNYNLISDQDSLDNDQITNWIKDTKRTLTYTGLKVYSYLYATNYPIQEVYYYGDIYKLEGKNYKKQNQLAYQPVSLVNANNYMNFYKRVSASNEQYKTNRVLTTIAGVSAGVGTVSAFFGPIGWLVTLGTYVASTTLGIIAYNQVNNKNTWWSNDGYTNKDITLEYTLPNQGLYNKLIQYDSLTLENNVPKLEASHFYYTTSENDYENYLESIEQGYGDQYFNKYSKFIPNYYYLSKVNRYSYKTCNLRILKPESKVNKQDEYLMLIYSTQEGNALKYFSGDKVFEETFSGIIENSLINNVAYSIFETLSTSFSFNDFQDIENKSLQQILEQQFKFINKGLTYSFRLQPTNSNNDDKLYMIIFHKENYKKLKADDPSLATYNDSEKLKKYNYAFYNNENDKIFTPKDVDNFVNGLYLPVSEEQLNIEDLEDATAFDKDRRYYKIENDKIVYYPTITQIIQQGSLYYYYNQNNYIYWETKKLEENTKVKFDIYNQKTGELTTEDFTVSQEYSPNKNILINAAVGGNPAVIDLEQLTNGLFWNQYNNNSNKTLNFLKEHAMIIETDLTNYWNQAYNASQLCQYFIPEHWQSYYDNQENVFKVYGEVAQDEIVWKTLESDASIEIIYPNQPIEDQEGWYKIYTNYEKKKKYVYVYVPTIQQYAKLTIDLFPNFDYYETLSDLLTSIYTSREIIKVDFYETASPNFNTETHTKTEYYQKYGTSYNQIIIQTDEDHPNQIGYTIASRITLNTALIPEVEKVLNNQNPYIFKLKYFSDTSEYFNYISDYNQDLRDQNKNDSNYQIIPLSDFTHWEPFTSLIQKFNLDVDKWLLIPQYVSTQGTYFRRTTGGTTWADLLQQLYPNKGSFPYFDGYYGLYMNYLKPENFIDGKMSEYEKYQTKHQELWSSLYKQFPSILLEQKYQNEDATNSLELLQMAKLAMQDFNNIEREYNITTIDTFALKGYEGQQINIGDSIALNAEELYTGFDDIKESLKQYLFVTDISYTLRQDTDVNLTVNKIKYQDKMIQQLAKLIK